MTSAIRAMSVASSPTPMKVDISYMSRGPTPATCRRSLVRRPLEAFAAHLFTSRPWLLGSTPNGDAAPAWLDVAAAVGVDLSHLARLHQVHGAHVVVAQQSLRPDADVVVSDDPDVALAI